MVIANYYNQDVAAECKVITRLVEKIEVNIKIDYVNLQRVLKIIFEQDPEIYIVKLYYARVN